MNETCYQIGLEGVGPGDLTGFCVGWSRPLSSERLYRVLAGSARVVLARDAEGRVIGFVNAISDGELMAFVPLLEVLPEHQGRGIGTHLVRLILDEFRGFYALDLLCDASLAPFYERLGFRQVCGMVRRDFGSLEDVGTLLA